MEAGASRDNDGDCSFGIPSPCLAENGGQTVSLQAHCNPREADAPHDEIAIKPKCSTDNNLPQARAQQRREPPALPRVHEEEDNVMLFNERFELRDGGLGLSDGGWRHRVAGHGDGKNMAGGILRGTRIFSSLFPSPSFEEYRSFAWRLTTPGKIRRRASAAAGALALPPSSESANSKSGCRTGLEKETVEESTKVILRTPQPCREHTRLH